MNLKSTPSWKTEVSPVRYLLNATLQWKSRAGKDGRDGAIGNRSEHRLSAYALRAAAASPSHEVLKMQELHGNTLQASTGAGVVWDSSLRTRQNVFPALSS